MRYCRAMMILAVLIAACLAAAFAVRMPMLAVIGLAALAAANRKTLSLTAFGTARWANTEELERAGMLSDRPGLILGHIARSRPRFLPALKGLFDRKVPPWEACERFVLSMRKLQPRTNTALVKLTPVHCAIFAPTGVGKGVSCVIPHLLNCPDSMVVVDFKGENAQLTAKHRREKFGHQTVILDPFCVVTQTPDTFNPLDMIDANSPLLIDDCRALAAQLVIRTGDETEPHWNDSAEAWISGMVAVAALHGEADDRSLQTARTVLTSPTKMAAVVKIMSESKELRGMIARGGNQLTYYKDKELNSVLTTTNRHLNFLDTLAIADSTTNSSFDPADLCKGKMTIYLVLPPEHMRTQSSLLRMWIGCCLKAVVRGGLQEKNKVHFVLDEAASLNKMSILDDAVDKYRGYGVRLLFFYQSLGQLEKCWGKGGDQTLLSNTTQIFFGVNDQQTAEHVSNRLGETTIVVESGGDNDGGSSQTSDNEPGTSRSTTWGRNRSWAQQARKLLRPEEVVNLSPRLAITFTPGVPPVLTRLTRYYEQPSLGKGRWQRVRWIAEVWLTAILLFLLTAAAMVTGLQAGLLR